MHKTSTFCFLASLVLAGSLLLSCSGDDDDDDSATTAGSGAASAVPVGFSVSGGIDVPVKLEVPASIQSGQVALSTTNSTPGVVDLQIVSVTGGHSIDEVKAVVDDDTGAPIPDWIVGEGGVGSIPPAQSGQATVVLEGAPGTQFFAVGTLQTDQESSPGSNSAAAALTMTGDEGGSLPSADTTIKASEYEFKIAGDDLQAGENSIRFENDGEQLHHVLMAPLADGSTLDDVRNFFSEDAPTPEAAPPLDFEKLVGTAVISGGKAISGISWELEPGTYAMVCFMTDKAGGAPHVMSGMIREVAVA